MKFGIIWPATAFKQADRVLVALEKALHRLAKNPGQGHWREDLADRRHRFFLVYSYLIVYRSETKPMQDPSSPRLTGHSISS
jgi:plasmid stabilization system protein ParE